MPLSEEQFDELALQRVVEFLNSNGIVCFTAEDFLEIETQKAIENELKKREVNFGRQSNSN